MTYPCAVSRVAAPERTAPTRLVDALSRPALRERGIEFELLVRAELNAAAHSTPALPEPKQLHKDCARGRAMSMVQYGAALASLAMDPAVSDARLMRLMLKLMAWVGSMRPRVHASLLDVWSAETKEQAEADVAQAHALSAIERNDRGALARAIDETTDHIAQQHELLFALQRAYRQLAPAPRRRLLARPVLAAAGSR
jgi:hypothetical protein